MFNLVNLGFVKISQIFLQDGFKFRSMVVSGLKDPHKVQKITKGPKTKTGPEQSELSPNYFKSHDLIIRVCRKIPD